jgi:DNA-binding NarL/FixJ family response regulator
MSIFTKRKPDMTNRDHEARARLAAEIATVRAVLARYHRDTKLHFGAPTRCPRCADYGFVRAVNRHRGVSHHDCFSCHAEWIISAAALKAVEDEPPPAELVPLAAAPQQEATVVELDAVTIEMDSPEPESPAVEAPATSDPAPFPDHPSIRPIPSPVGPGTVTPLPRQRRSSRDRNVLRVLVIDDNPFDVAVIEELIGGLPQDTVELRHVGTLADGLHHALFERVDVVLLDLGLPDSQGVPTLLEWQLASTTASPVIVVTGDNHPDTVRESQLLGAAQFVHKQHIADLVNRADGSAKLLRLLQTTVAAATSGTAAPSSATPATMTTSHTQDA